MAPVVSSAPHIRLSVRGSPRYIPSFLPSFLPPSFRPFLLEPIGAAELRQTTGRGILAKRQTEIRRHTAPLDIRPILPGAEKNPASNAACGCA